MLVSFVIGGNPRVVHIFGLAALILEGYSSSQAKSSSWAACSEDHGIPKWVVMEYDNRVRCRYNDVNFLKNIMGMGCLLWIQHLIDILPEFPKSSMQYLTIFDVLIVLLLISRSPTEAMRWWGSSDHLLWQSFQRTLERYCRGAGW